MYHGRYFLQLQVNPDCIFVYCTLTCIVRFGKDHKSGKYKKVSVGV